MVAELLHRQGGLPVLGTIPGMKPHSSNGASSSGSRLMMWIGTDRDAPSPVISGAGWWSPRMMISELSVTYREM